MIEFLLGAAVSTVASKKLRDKSKDEIKDMLSEGLETTGKVFGAAIELATDKITKPRVDNNSNSKDMSVSKDNNTSEEITMSKM